MLGRHDNRGYYNHIDTRLVYGGILSSIYRTIFYFIFSTSREPVNRVGTPNNIYITSPLASRSFSTRTNTVYISCMHIERMSGISLRGPGCKYVYTYYDGVIRKICVLKREVTTVFERVVKVSRNVRWIIQYTICGIAVRSKRNDKTFLINYNQQSNAQRDDVKKI